MPRSVSRRRVSSRRGAAAPVAGPRLGLVCQTFSEAVRFRVVTRTRFLQMDEREQRQTLTRLYRTNLARLIRALRFCHRRGIGLYRCISNVFPLCDEPIGPAVLDALGSKLAQVGPLARRLGVRVVAHPDQFIVLNSESPRVVETSLHLIGREAAVFDRLGLERSAWSCLIVHGGKSGRADALLGTIDRLPPGVRDRLALENDERAYGAAEIFDLCRRSGLPMVFDAHHHVIKEKLGDFEHPSVRQWLEAAAGTWPDPAWQVVHLSNGREGFNDPRHSEFIAAVPSCYAAAPWVEVEAKGKERAIADLRRRWKPAR
jgi:UV DNA damage endonuclease